jgi:hypothetical protein
MVGLPVISRFNKGRQARNTELAHRQVGFFTSALRQSATEFIGRLNSLTMLNCFTYGCLKKAVITQPHVDN